MRDPGYLFLAQCSPITKTPQTFHEKPYSALDLHRPELSQAGKTVLVSGGSTGIGRAIARSFCQAGAASVIILSRRPAVLQATVADLQAQFPNTKVAGVPCNVMNRADINKVWDDFCKPENDVQIDVLVLSAVGAPAPQPILEQGIDRLWEDYENNIRSQLYMVERLWKQPEHDRQKVIHFSSQSLPSPSFVIAYSDNRQFCLYVSSKDAHVWDSAPYIPGYQLTKNGCTCALQQIARDTPVEKMQILSFHPSIIFTEAAAGVGLDENSYPWADGRAKTHSHELVMRF
jgi:NAD(P)-dependent dehydrogenase (short-subunit alcohol dehydrogenase family)